MSKAQPRGCTLKFNFWYCDAGEPVSLHAQYDLLGQLRQETISLREGTCRDFAHLFLEAARSVGIASRYVSGYLCSSPGDPVENHTHGWCEVYLPGAGWRGFDPTNGILAGPHHVVVATSVAAGDIPPVEGSYCGEPGLCLTHGVTISARELFPAEES